MQCQLWLSRRAKYNVTDLAERPPPRTPQDLTSHDCINLRLPARRGIYEAQLRHQVINAEEDWHAALENRMVPVIAALRRRDVSVYADDKQWHCHGNRVWPATWRRVKLEA
jgi:hypothetical protein